MNAYKVYLLSLSNSSNLLIFLKIIHSRCQLSRYKPFIVIKCWLRIKKINFFSFIFRKSSSLCFSQIFFVMLFANLLCYILRKSSSLYSSLLSSLYFSQIFFAMLSANLFRYALRRSSSLYFSLLSLLCSSQIFFVMLSANFLCYILRRSSSLCSSQIFFVTRINLNMHHRRICIIRVRASHPNFVVSNEYSLP